LLICYFIIIIIFTVARRQVLKDIAVLFLLLLSALNWDGKRM